MTIEQLEQEINEYIDILSEVAEEAESEIVEIQMRCNAELHLIIEHTLELVNELHIEKIVQLCLTGK